MKPVPRYVARFLPPLLPLPVSLPCSTTSVSRRTAVGCLGVLGAKTDSAPACAHAILCLCQSLSGRHTAMRCWHQWEVGRQTAAGPASVNKSQPAGFSHHRSEKVLESTVVLKSSRLFWRKQSSKVCRMNTVTE